MKTHWLSTNSSPSADSLGKGRSLRPLRSQPLVTSATVDRHSMELTLHAKVMTRKKVHNEWHTTAWIANKKRCKNHACKIWKHSWLCIRNSSTSDPDASPNSATHSAKMQLHSTLSHGLCLDVGTSWSLDTVFLPGPFNSKTHCYVSHIYIYIYNHIYNYIYRYFNRYVYRCKWMILCDYIAIGARKGKYLCINMDKLHPLRFQTTIPSPRHAAGLRSQQPIPSSATHATLTTVLGSEA